MKEGLLFLIFTAPGCEVQLDKYMTSCLGAVNPSQVEICFAKGLKMFEMCKDGNKLVTIWTDAEKQK